MSTLLATIAASSLFAMTAAFAPAVLAETGSPNPTAPMGSEMQHHGMMGGMMGSHRGTDNGDQTGSSGGMMGRQDMMSMMDQCNEMMQSQATPPNGQFKTAPDESPAR